MKPDMEFPFVKWLPFPTEIQEIIWKINRKVKFDSRMTYLENYFNETELLIILHNWCYNNYIEDLQF